MLEIVYLKNGNELTTNTSCEDFIISASGNNRNIITIKTKCPIILKSARINNIWKISDDNQFFLNGYQSWSATRISSLKNKEKNLNKVPRKLRDKYCLDTYGDSSFYHYDKNKMHGYDLFYLEGKNELFSFNHNYKTSYLIYEINKKDKMLSLESAINGLKIEENEECTIFDYSLYESITEGKKAFYECFPLMNKEKLFGYCSWYNYYNNINEDIINRDIDSLDDRFNLVQIDDGFQEFVGDWMNIDKRKFPNGLKQIVDNIHAKGKKAGIWVAPFAAESESDIFKTHPEYFLRRNGEFVKVGTNWSGFYTFDLENRDALLYIKECLQYLMDLGFDFFKLDFLYIASLNQYDGKTRAMVARNCYEFLRDVLKDKLILGCGASLFSSIGLFDYMRIGTDVVLSLNEMLIVRLLGLHKVSTKMTLKNTIYRSMFNHHLFLNDPDVFILRNKTKTLNKKNKVAIAKINSLFSGILLTSDDVGTYDEFGQALLNEVYDIFCNAKEQKFSVFKNRVNVSYKLNNKKHSFIYDVKKGVIK